MKRLSLVWISILITSSVAAEESPVPSPPMNALYLCTHCRFDGAHVRDFYKVEETQMSMFRAQNGKMISVGSGVVPVSAAKKAKALGMPVYTTPLGDKSLLQSHISPEGISKSPRSYMNEKILGYLKQLDRTKPVVIHVSNHGWNDALTGPGKLSPEKSGIALRTQADMSEGPGTIVLTHEQFANMMKNAGLVGPGAPPVRIVADHCYGGGIHWISENFPNVCTVAFSSNEVPNYLIDDESRAFWDYVGAEKKAGRKVSMTSAFYAGFSKQNKTVGAALGSTQYAQNILRKNNLLGKEEVISDDTLTEWSSWDRLNLIKQNVDSCSLDPLVPPISSKQISDVQDILDTLYSPTDEEGKEYQLAVNALKKTGSADQLLLQQYQQRSREAKAQWAKLTLEQKAIRSREYTESIGDFLRWTTGNFEESKNRKLESALGKGKNLESEFLLYRKKNYPRIREYLKNRELVARTRELKTFASLYEQKKISEKEMENYRRMVACESAPL